MEVYKEVCDSLALVGFIQVSLAQPASKSFREFFFWENLGKKKVFLCILHGKQSEACYNNYCYHASHHPIPTPHSFPLPHPQPEH